jgi:hypothetical protein
MDRHIIIDPHPHAQNRGGNEGQGQINCFKLRIALRRCVGYLHQNQLNAANNQRQQKFFSDAIGFQHLQIP